MVPAIAQSAPPATPTALDPWWTTLAPGDLTPWILGALRVVIILTVVAVFYRIARRGIRLLVQRQHLNTGLCVMINRVLFWIAIAAAVFLTLQTFGILQDAWTTLTAIIAMVAIGFVAVWSVLSNSLCSVILMFTRPFLVGDTIEVRPDGFKGRVVDFSMIYTTIEPEEGGLLRIPNNLFFQKAIHCQPGDHRIALDQQVETDHPID